MSRIYLDGDPSDRSVAADVLVREEPDEEGDEEDDEKGDDEKQNDEDEGYCQ